MADKGPFQNLFRSSPKTIDAKQNLTIDCGNLLITGDVLVLLYDKYIDKKNPIARIWFNTAFIDQDTLKLRKNEIDEIASYKSELYDKDFEIELFFYDSKVSQMERLQRAHELKLKEYQEQQEKESQKSKRKATRKNKEKSKRYPNGTKSKSRSKKTELDNKKLKYQFSDSSSGSQLGV